MKNCKQRFKVGTVLILALLATMLLASCAKSDDQKYTDAQKLLTEGKLEEAVTAFTEIENYMDSSKYVMYIRAILLAEGGEYKSALRSFESLGEFKDSPLMGIYYMGRSYEAAMKYGEAEDVYRTIETFRDSGQRLADVSVKAWSAVGSTVNFGHYEQDNDRTNGKERIKWQVLEVKEDRVLLISKYALDSRRYEESSWGSITWETCDLREWLNSNFLNEAFTDEELARIPTVTVLAHKNPESETDPGNDTQDRVFLLSIPEANQYFTSKEAMRAVPTAYAIRHGAITLGSTTEDEVKDMENYYGISIYDFYTESGEAACWWWLRSPGGDSYYSDTVACVDGSGCVSGGVMNSAPADTDQISVRPAIWVNLG